jgi:hypothetical protein
MRHNAIDRPAAGLHRFAPDSGPTHTPPRPELVTVDQGAPPPPVIGGTDTVTFYDTDAIGSVRMITDADGEVLARYDYTPFGAVIEDPDVTNTRQFARSASVGRGEKNDRPAAALARARPHRDRAG